MVLLLKIGPGKADISINNHSRLINLLKRRVFQLLQTLNVKNLKLQPQIWKQLGKLFSKVVLLLKIEHGKAFISINNRTQIISSLKKTVFQDLHNLKIENFKFQCQNLKSARKILSKNGPTFENQTWEGSHIHQ